MTLELFNASRATAVPPAPFPVSTGISPESAVRILLLEDNPGDATLIEQMLKDSRDKFQLTHFDRLKTALECLTRDEFHVILSDLGLPDATRLDAARRLRAAAPATALIVMTGMNDKETASDALKYGAQDFLVKGEFKGHSLVHSIDFAITRHQTLQATERIRAQEQQLKEEFLSNVSHELRSPLAVISSFASILEDELAGTLNDEQHQYARVILKNAGQLNSMVDDLLEVTRVQAGKLSVEPQCVSLKEVVQDVVQGRTPHAAEKEIRIFSVIESSVPNALADPIRVSQVLQNLITNAIKFTPAGGEICVRLARNPVDFSTLLLEVSDTGCGIAREAQGRIFDRLHQEINQDTGGRKGLGLGLYICREIVSRLGGKIWVESAPGEGSRFFVTLPVFSLYKILSPAILNCKEKPDSLAVVSTRIAASEIGTFSADISYRVRDTLEHCISPNLDVLLPRLNSAAVQELFWVFAVADEEGIKVLVRRVEDQLRRLEAIQSGKITFSVNYQMFEREPIRKRLSREELACWAAEKMDEILLGVIPMNKKDSH